MSIPARGLRRFKRGQWTFEFDRGDEGNKFKLDEVSGADVQLLGRRTYEGFAAAWPSRNDEFGFAERMNTMPKYVFSSTLEQADWENTTILSGDFATEISKLKDEVDGDELRLMVFPVLLGYGKRLFGEHEEKKTLKLTDSKTVGGDGVLILTYEPA